MNARQKCKKLKQELSMRKLFKSSEITLDRTQLEHLRCKVEVPYFYGNRYGFADSPEAIEQAKRELVDRLSKRLMDGAEPHVSDEMPPYIELDIWLKPLGGKSE